MAQPTLGPGKRRYSLSLTSARVDRFKNVCKRLGLPAATMSNALDDVLDVLSETFEMAIDKKQMKISDLINLMGKHIGEIEELEEAKIVPEQKRRTVRKSKNSQ